MPSGCYSRLTAADIAAVRDVYRRYESVQRERREQLAKLRIGRDHWRQVGQGISGKKPADSYAR